MKKLAHNGLNTVIGNVSLEGTAPVIMISFTGCRCMFERFKREAKKHPYLSAIFVFSFLIPFVALLTLTGLGLLPAGLGIGTALFGAGLAANILNWSITTLVSCFFSVTLSALCTTVVDMISTEAEAFQSQRIPTQPFSSATRSSTRHSADLSTDTESDQANSEPVPAPQKDSEQDKDNAPRVS